MTFLIIELSATCMKKWMRSNNYAMPLEEIFDALK